MRIVLLVVCGLIFALWTVSMFRTLFALHRRAVARTGKALPGPIDTLQEWGVWLRDPEFQKERRRLCATTVGVILLAYLLSANHAFVSSG